MLSRSSLRLGLCLGLLAAGAALPAGAAMLEEKAAIDAASTPTWMFVEGTWGRIEIGRTHRDGAATGLDAMRLSRTSEPQGVLLELLRPASVPTMEADGDRTRMTAFTPRVLGLQSNATAGRGDVNPSALALGFRERLGDLGFRLGATVEPGDEAAGRRAGWGLGGRVDLGGFELGAGYREFGFGRAMPDGEAERRWDVGVGFASGAWSLGAGLSLGFAENGASGPTSAISLVGGYTPAAGWDLRAGIDFVEFGDKREPGEGRAGAIVVISSILTF